MATKKVGTQFCRAMVVGSSGQSSRLTITIWVRILLPLKAFSGVEIKCKLGDVIGPFLT